MPSFFFVACLCPVFESIQKVVKIVLIGGDFFLGPPHLHSAEPVWVFVFLVTFLDSPTSSQPLETQNCSQEELRSHISPPD